MAIREVRINFNSKHRELSRQLNGFVGQPFTWLADGIMRGRFKEYSGAEVKGVNIINLNCYDDTFDELIEIESTPSWKILGNTYDCDIKFSFEDFYGSRIEQVAQAVDLFLVCSTYADLPQIKKFVLHLRDGINQNRIEKGIKTADEYRAFIIAERNEI